MSYGEDLMIEMLINEAVEGEERRNDMCRLYGALGAKTWISANGTTISIRKMDDRHIRNCISMLKRNMPLYDEPFDRIALKYIELLEAEIQTRYPPKDASRASLAKRRTNSLRKVYCDYCGRETEYVDSKVIYGKSYGKIYLCRNCMAYVGVHKGTDKPLGRLANAELRNWKKGCTRRI